MKVYKDQLKGGGNMSLSEEELTLLQTLQNMTRGSTAALSAVTLIAPNKLKRKILKLKEKGLIVYRETPESPEGDFVGLTLDGERLLERKR